MAPDSAGVTELFTDALRYPFADRTRLDGTVICFVSLLLVGLLFRVAAQLWPDWAAVIVLVVAAGPALGFVGLLGGVLAGDGFPELVSRHTVRLAGRLLGVAVVYLLPAAIVIAGVAFVTATGALPELVSGVTTATLATVALLVTVVAAYLFPAAAAVSVRDGLRAGLKRTALRGTASSAYFLAWVGAVVLVVVAWSALAATASRSVLALLALGWVAYTHVVAAALLADGIERTHHW